MGHVPSSSQQIKITASTIDELRKHGRSGKRTHIAAARCVCEGGGGRGMLVWP